MALKNLGTVAAIYYGTVAPDNERILWYDENVLALKYYNTNSSSWDTFTVSAGQIKLNSGDSLDYLQNKLHSSLQVASGQLKIETSLLTKINGAVQATNNLSDVTASTSRTNLSVYSKAEVDGVVGNRSYTYGYNVVNGQNLTTSVNGLDTAVGNRSNYTNNYVIADAESVAASLNKLDTAFGTRQYSANYNVTDGESITASIEKLDLAIGNKTDYSSNNIIVDGESIATSAGRLDAAFGNRTYTSQYIITNGQSVTTSLNAIDLAIGNKANYSSNNYITDGDNLAVALGKLDQNIYASDFQRGGTNAGSHVLRAYAVTQFSPRQESLASVGSSCFYIKLGKIIYLTGFVQFTTPSSAWANQAEILIKFPTSGGFPTATLESGITFSVNVQTSAGATIGVTGYARSGGDYDAYQNEFILQKTISTFSLNTTYIAHFSAILFTSNIN